MRILLTSWIVICLSQVASAQNVDQNYQLLWEVTNDEGAKSYVFGSLHSNDKRLFNFPDSAYIAMMNVDAIALETDIFSIFETVDTRVGTVSLKFDNRGRPYTEENYASETVYGNEDGMPQFLDAYLQQFCYNANKEFIALETIEFQMGLFDNIDYKPSVTEFDFSSLLSSKEDMVDLYIKGDIQELNEFVQSGLSLIPDMYESLIVERNIDMVEKLDSIMAQKSVFCAVGAGHLAGPSGVLDLLRDKGYVVRKVLATYSEEETDAEGQFKSYRDYSVDESQYGLHMVFPGKPLRTEIDTIGFVDETFLDKWIYSDLGQGNKYVVEVYLREAYIESWEDVAAEYIPSPEESRYEKIELPNGGEAVQGLGEEYWDDAMWWTRVIMTEEYVVVLKASGGNKFMNSPRAYRFFDQIWLD